MERRPSDRGPMMDAPEGTCSCVRSCLREGEMQEGEMHGRKRGDIHITPKDDTTTMDHHLRTDTMTKTEEALYAFMLFGMAF